MKMLMKKEIDGSSLKILRNLKDIFTEVKNKARTLTLKFNPLLLLILAKRLRNSVNPLLDELVKAIKQVKSSRSTKNGKKEVQFAEDMKVSPEKSQESMISHFEQSESSVEKYVQKLMASK